MDGTGIDRAVLVQAFSSYQYDNRYTADAAAAYPDRMASSCIIDLEDNPAKMVRYWVGERGARAIRLFLRNVNSDWLVQAPSDEVFVELRRLGAVAQVVGMDADLPFLLPGRRAPSGRFRSFSTIAACPTSAEDRAIPTRPTSSTWPKPPT